MRQSILEIRQRANELLEESLKIWKQSDNAESLEGIEKDPVFAMLMTALAYQANEAENDIERFKQEVANEIAYMLTPFEIGHATPATAVIETMPQPSLDRVEINEDSVFKTADDFSFIPLFHSSVLNVSIESIERLDGRRWKVTLDFFHPVSDLSGFCFAIRNVNFKSLNIRIKGNKLPLIRPWNYSELPFTKCFDIESLSYNHGAYYSASMLALDLFARQNIRMFWINKQNAKISQEINKIDLIFEFTGIKEDFVFEEKNLILNTVMLVNASIKEASLSSSSPIARLSGYSNSNNGIDGKSQQFLHLIRPGSEQAYSNVELEVRKVSGDRFNQGSLVRLLNFIINKYHTDFYAYQNLPEMKNDKLIYNLQDLLHRLVRIAQQDYIKNMSGVYLLLQDRNRMKDTGFSVQIKYLTTSGAAVNKTLSQELRFKTPPALNDQKTQQICPPQPGVNEIESQNEEKSLLKYYIVTGDRIVTPADIKLFCITELNRRYSIGEDMIKSIEVNTKLSQEDYGVGYEILVEIVLKGSSMIKRTVTDKIPTMESLFQKMMEVRTTGIYPIRVNFTISE